MTTNPRDPGQAAVGLVEPGKRRGLCGLPPRSGPEPVQVDRVGMRTGEAAARVAFAMIALSLTDGHGGLHG